MSFFYNQLTVTYYNLKVLFFVVIEIWVQNLKYNSTCKLLDSGVGFEKLSYYLEFWRIYFLISQTLFDK